MRIYKRIKLHVLEILDEVIAHKLNGWVVNLSDRICEAYDQALLESIGVKKYKDLDDKDRKGVSYDNHR